jgi:hypothetical protein
VLTGFVEPAWTSAVGDHFTRTLGYFAAPDRRLGNQIQSDREPERYVGAIEKKAGSQFHR